MTRLLALSTVFAVLSVPTVVSAQQPDEDTRQREADDRGQRALEQQEAIEQKAGAEDDETDEDEEENGEEVRLGLVGGPAVTFIETDLENVDEASDALVRYSFGAHAEYSYERAIGVALEVLYSRRGWETGSELEGLDEDTNFEFSYIDVPLMLQLGIPISDTFAPRLLAGGYASVFLDGSRESAIDDPFVGEEQGTDIQSDEVNTFQYGLTGGVGVGFDLNGAAVTIDIRYLHGLSGVFDTPLTGDEADEIHHRGVSAMLGFFF